MHAGLVGGGNITETHARAAREAGVTIAAVCGSNADRTGRLAHGFGCEAYTDLRPFLAHRPMDFVIIGSPSGLHAQQGIAAAESGLHLLVEKPIDISTERADELIARAASAGVTLGIIFQDRVKPDILRLKRMLDGGELGRLVLATAHVKWYRPPDYYSSSRWRGTAALDGGTLLNQGIHTIDLLRWLMGPVAAIGGRVKTAVHQIEAEDTAVATLEFASGALATIEVTTAAFPGFERRVEISGENGTVVLVGDEIKEVRLKEDSRGSGLGARDSKVLGTDQATISAASPVVTDVSAHRGIIEDFVAAIREHRGPVCNGEEGRRSVAIIEAIHTSARSGRFVESNI
jgi:UDP-N-acetyl-2-amino-2-deoxyglucuronate dehydrogenase